MKKFNEFIKEEVRQLKTAGSRDGFGNKPAFYGDLANWKDILKAQELIKESKKLLEEATNLIGVNNIKSPKMVEDFNISLRSLNDLKDTVGDKLHWDVFLDIDDETIEKYGKEYGYE